MNRLLAKLEKRFGTHRYDQLDTLPTEKRAELMKYAEHPPAKLAGSPIAEIKTFDGVKYIAENGAWLMLRIRHRTSFASTPRPARTPKQSSSSSWAPATQESNAWPGGSEPRFTEMAIQGEGTFLSPH